MDETVKSQGKILRSVHTHKSIEQCHNNKRVLEIREENPIGTIMKHLVHFYFCHNQKARIIQTKLITTVMDYIL